ncbi:hypothetical protein D3C72_1182220 [compost metagenome]
MKYFLAVCFLVLSACTTYEVLPSGRALKTNDEYVEIIEANSAKARQYSGFYNLLDIEGTLITSAVADGQLDVNTRQFQWDDSKYDSERAKFQERLNRETEIFLAFFTPEKKNDDLTKATTTWKIFLDAGGRRYEGKVTKIKMLPSDIIAIYPFYTRFQTPYSVIFPVPMKSIEGGPIKFTITGPVASVSLNYGPQVNRDTPNPASNPRP